MVSAPEVGISCEKRLLPFKPFRGRLFIGVLYKGITPDIIFWPHVRVIENGVIFLLRSGSLHFLLLGEMMRI